MSSEITGLAKIICFLQSKAYWITPKVVFREGLCSETLSCPFPSLLLHLGVPPRTGFLPQDLNPKSDYLMAECPWMLKLKNTHTCSKPHLKLKNTHKKVAELVEGAGCGVGGGPSPLGHGFVGSCRFLPCFSAPFSWNIPAAWRDFWFGCSISSLREGGTAGALLCG